MASIILKGYVSALTNHIQEGLPLYQVTKHGATPRMGFAQKFRIENKIAKVRSLNQ
jgi:hypothetical protein